MADATPRLGFPYLHAGQAQKEVWHNEALMLADILVQAKAESAALSAPPASPAEGMCWVVGPSPSGDWAGKAGMLACWTGGGWRFVAPRAGMCVWVEDEEMDYRHDGSGWSKAPLRADGLYLAGQKVVGERQAGIAEPSGGSNVDVEARTAILAILNALRNHGLIDEIV
jgi:hypothetical protein